VNPRRAGSDVDGIPVFATVAEAVEQTGADVSVVFVPPAVREGRGRRGDRREDPAAVVITEGIPVQGQRLVLGVSQGTAPARRPELTRPDQPRKSNAGIIPATDRARTRDASGWSARAAR
jgi:succinyl-CoA synthetase alpha subunit